MQNRGLVTLGYKFAALILLCCGIIAGVLFSVFPVETIERVSHFVGGGDAHLNRLLDSLKRASVFEQGELLSDAYARTYSDPEGKEKFVEAAPLIESLILDSETRADFRFMLVNVLENLGRLQEQEQVLQGLLQDFPDPGTKRGYDVRFMLAMLKLRPDDFADAATAFAELRPFSKKISFDCQVNLGVQLTNVYANAERFTEAIEFGEETREILMRGQTDARLLYLLSDIAYCAFKTEQFELAAARYDELEKAIPMYATDVLEKESFQSQLESRGRIARELARDRKDAARQVLNTFTDDAVTCPAKRVPKSRTATGNA